jgi:hypothetical protein
MLLIYTHRLTSRSKYTFKLIFEDILGLAHEITTDKVAFKKHQGPKITYCRQPVDDELFFFATELLFENGIVVQEPGFLTWGGTKVFYPTIRNSVLPFDPFAASFFLVSRYEEYLPHMRDQHGRFEAKQSLAYLHGFLQKPVVNYWAIEILRLIEERYGKQKLKERHYSFRPTIDIDNAWAFRHKGFIRMGGGMIADLFNFNFEGFRQRFKAVFHLAHDPYDTYEYQIELIQRHQLSPIFFILLGDYATFDKNVPHQNKHMQSLIKYLGDFGEVGIHPSYASNEQADKLPKEIARLSYILHQEIHLSRQHFLRLNVPDTYQRLLECDITDDYTMGYPDQPGFRASICSPYFFYDLDLEIETALRLHPFAIMDGTLRDYMNISPEQAAAIINPLIEEVKKVKGEFITVWHNESFAENERWKGWRNVYEEMIEKALA